jgi:hypothetical protein
MIHVLPVNRLNQQDDSPFHVLPVNRLNQQGDSPLHVACKLRQIDIVQLLLNTHGIRVDALNLEGNSALHISSELNHVAIVQLLLNTNGIQLHRTNHKGDTALKLACLSNHVDVIKLLVANRGPAREHLRLPPADEDILPLITGFKEACDIGIILSLVLLGHGACNMNVWFNTNIDSFSRMQLVKHVHSFKKQHGQFQAFQACLKSAQSELVPESSLSIFRLRWPSLVNETVESFLVPTCKAVRATLNLIEEHWRVTINKCDPNTLHTPGHTPLSRAVDDLNVEDVAYLCESSSNEHLLRINERMKKEGSCHDYTALDLIIHKIENHRMVNDIPTNPWWLDAGELSSCHKIVQILVRNGADARTTNVKKWLRGVYG